MYVKVYMNENEPDNLLLASKLAENMFFFQKVAKNTFFGQNNFVLDSLQNEILSLS